MKKSKCECCENQVQSTLIIKNDGLVNVRLSQDSFLTLIRNGHSPDEFLLHEDFYR